ncbi:hypothetical protein [Gemmata massiliana]|uniref:hypothetical protein n=1 Tax=Gemmata massiliana TaxID=1210884 RepID=UPI0013A6C1C0|nr:hypothetical protein [Gemmata massiliana]
MERARQALLDRVSELADEPQEKLLRGIADELRRQLNVYRVPARPPKVPFPRATRSER